MESKVEVDPDLMQQARSAVDVAPKAREAQARPASEPGGSRRLEEPERAGVRPPARRGPALLGVPIWVLAVLAVTGLGALLVVMDLRNRDRFLLVCHGRALELHQGRRFPWPFGHEAVGGEAYQPLELPEQADCRDRVFPSQPEAEKGLLEQLTARARADLDRGGGNDLKATRAVVLQALALTRTHRERRREVQGLLAEVDYLEGRRSLSRVESQLRTALGLFKEAHKLDGARFSDLGKWIERLEVLLRSVTPTPGPLAETPAARAASSGPAPGKKTDAGAPAGDGAKRTGPRDAGRAPDAGPARKPDSAAVDPGGILL